MEPIDENNKASDQSDKQGSLLLRLWGKYVTKKEPAADDVPKDENTPKEVEVQDLSASPKDSLYYLWEKWREQEAGASEFSPMEFVNDTLESEMVVSTDDEALIANSKLEESNRKELLRFGDQLLQEAEEILAQEALKKDPALGDLFDLEFSNSTPEQEVDPAQETEPEPPQPVNAQIRIRASKEKLKAWLFVFPPSNGGEDVTKSAIKEMLAQEGILYGIQDDMIRKLCEERLYFKVIEVAIGMAAVDGKDGEVIDCFPRETKLEIKEDENGIVDYKSMNLIRNVSRGDTICTIIQPTEAINGTDITGKKLLGKQGNPPYIQKSTGIELSEDGAALIASLDGQLTVKDDKFVVEKLLQIDGDVDSSTGNIDFNGDVTVQGDVREGFLLKAKGNIIVKGMVEDTVIISGGSIIIEKGMNGNGKGSLDAQGDVKCKFIENCVVNAGGSVYAGSIICSNVCCNGELVVTTGKGVIIGGSCTVHKLLEARVIGSKSNRSTTIVIGNTPIMINKKLELETQLKNLQAEIESINKDMAFADAGGRVSRDKQAFINQVKLKRPLLLMQEKQLVRQIEKLSEEMKDVSESRIKCGTIYPPTKLVIGKEKMIVEEVHNRCNIYYSNGSIVIGTQ